MEIQLKGSKKETERYEKELNKQLETFNKLDQQMSELKKSKITPEQPQPSVFKKQQTETPQSTGNDSKTSSPNINKKGTQSMEDNKKAGVINKKTGATNESEDTKGTEKKGNKSGTYGGESDLKISEYEEKIKNLNKKIEELENFIGTGIDDGFNSNQYSKLQKNLETLGFPQLKKQFKVHKTNTAEYETPVKNIKGKVGVETKDQKITENKTQGVSEGKTTGNEVSGNAGGKYNFETPHEAMGFDKNVSYMKESIQCAGLDKITPQTNQTPSDQKNGNFSNTGTTTNDNHGGISNNNNENNNTVPNPSNAVQKKSTIQIVIISPSKEQEQKQVFEDKSVKRESVSKFPEERKSELPLLKLSSGDSKTEETKSPETKREDKPEAPKILPPPPPLTPNSEVNSPCNSPMNVPPLPPPLGGNKPGMPPGLNILSLLNKKPAGPVKEKKKPNVPMKNVLWTLVNPLNIKGTIWETIDESTVAYEIPSLETEFTSVRPDKPATKSAIPAKISLLAPNRAQNISIVLSKLKMSPATIVDALLAVNEEVLNLNMVNCLLDAIPSPDEISLISNYNGEYDMLENPEKYILEIKDVKSIKVRLQALQFYFTHKELFDDLQLKIKKLIELFENISKEQRIIVLMKYTLAIGNYMNGESARGGAFGFKLDAFDKIADIKNINGKKNLLAYVIEVIELNSGSKYIQVDEEFPLYEFGRKQPISQLFSDLDFIKKGIENVKNAKQNKNVGVVDNIEEFMGKFEVEVGDKYQDVEFDLGTLDQKYKRVCEFYCEDPKQTSSDVFVENFYKIWAACKKAKAILVKENKENLREKAKEKTEKPGFFIRVNGFFFLKVDSAEEIECWTVQ